MLICIDGTENANFSKFKSMITGDTSLIERRRVDIITVTNYNSYAICSRDDVSVDIQERDIRYFVVKCSNEYVGDTQYFETLVNECFNQDVGNLFYSYLYSDAINGCLVPLRPVPITSAKAHIIETLRQRTHTRYH